MSIVFSACTHQNEPLFIELPSSETGVDFQNTLTDSEDLNIRKYLYYYNGGGIAAGDLNNNGLPDLFFTGNQTHNKLYENLGDFKFRDITETAGIIDHERSWSTGVTMADITGNGYLDIFVSRVNYLGLEGKNQLFINNGNMTFTEMAPEYGVDFEGYTTQSVFFDYNNDGRLDLFILNHSFHSRYTHGEAELLRKRQDPKAGDRLFRNDGDKFTDVTAEAGIISSAVGYGLGVAISDINQNGYPDIYVGNDFHEDDYFYINNGDGTFTQRLYEMISHTSYSSMGNDIGDLNNDGLMDIVSMDMMAVSHRDYMSSTGPDSWMVMNAVKSYGFGEKNHRNTLQLNQGIGPDGLPKFSDIAFSSGAAITDWSWAALLADFNNNGFNDLFVTNGLPHRPTDLDVVKEINNNQQTFMGRETGASNQELIERMPSAFTHNYMFKNNGDLTFEEVSKAWGFEKPTASNGAVYADLNGNGRLDLVVNHINETASIYKNSTTEDGKSHYLQVSLKGDGLNTTGVGAKVFVYHKDKLFYREQFPARGFQSSVSHVLHMGLGDIENPDSLLVIWPDSRYQYLYEVPIDSRIQLDQKEAVGYFDYSLLQEKNQEQLFNSISESVLTSEVQLENDFSDFSREPLMPYMLSTRGSALAVGDITGNGLDDIYLGGSAGNPGKLFLQKEDGSFIKTEQPAFQLHYEFEDVDAIFFDANGNGFKDLYVVSGGNEYSENMPQLRDRLYLNNGEGIFIHAEDNIPDIRVNGSVVRAADLTEDGTLDLFVGGHSIPWQYGVTPKSTLLINDGTANFTDQTSLIAPDLEYIGNVTSAEWFSSDSNESSHLIVAGEWMPVTIFENRNGFLVKKDFGDDFPELHGLWQSLSVADLTQNGLPDIVAGNFGTNNRFQPHLSNPIYLYAHDFDGNGQSDPIIAYFSDDELMPFDQLDELLLQIPGLRHKVDSYSEFSQLNLSQLFSEEMLDQVQLKFINELRSTIFLNRGDGRFTVQYADNRLQHFPVMSMLLHDLDGDDHTDLLAGGNIFGVRPSIGGRQDSGYGLFMKGSGDATFSPIGFNESGFYSVNEIRSIGLLRRPNSGKLVLVVRNNDEPLLFNVNN